jgi:signal transduction histidine kinase
MDQLISDLLEYSRLEDSATGIHPCSLDQCAEAAIAQLEQEIKGSGAKITLETRPLGSVMANRVLLITIVANLLSNAIKFTIPDKTPEVALSSEIRDGRVRLWVADNGIGIEPADRERIFRVFERLNGMERYPGTGIGLAIVRKGVLSLGGRLGVEDGKAGGSRFWIELPAGNGLPG